MMEREEGDHENTKTRKKRLTRRRGENEMVWEGRNGFVVTTLNAEN